jgi:lysophospholipase L1-like esterase
VAGDGRHGQAYGGTYLPASRRSKENIMENRAVRRRRSAFAAFLATVAMAVGFTAVPADAAPRRHVDYVALGDSYTAGIGAGPYIQTPGCIQTSGGYVDVVGKTGRVDLLLNAACSGAQLFGGETSVAAQLSHAETLSALSEAELVSITAGANDLGFAQVLGICATMSVASCEAIVSGRTSDANLLLLYSALKQTYEAIQAAAPDAKIVVLGYPKLFDETEPAASLPIPLESQELVNAGTVKLNTVIEAAARAAGAEYIDVTDEFAGHEVNSNDPWIFFTAPTISNGNLVFDDRNFHPNKEGHRAYASALLEAVKPAQLVR